MKKFLVCLFSMGLMFSVANAQKEVPNTLPTAAPSKGVKEHRRAERKKMHHAANHPNQAHPRAAGKRMPHGPAGGARSH